MFGLEDMTYCTADCAMKDGCYRNPALIKEPQYPHSFADFSKNCMAYEPKDEPQTENPCDGCVCDDGKHLMYCMNCKGIAWKTEPPKIEDKPHIVGKHADVTIIDEPQTDTEIAKAIVHKMIDDAVIAEDAYPDLRQRMHDAVDNYEPQTGSEQ